MQNFGIMAQEVPLIQFLQKVEAEYDVKFAYDYDLLSPLNTGSFDFSQPLDQLLDRVLEPNDLFFEKSKRVIMIKPIAKVVTGLDKNSKGRTMLSGFLRDGQSGEPLENATLMISSIRRYSTTNMYGYFSLRNIPSDTSTILIKYIGYQTKKLRPLDFDRQFVNLTLIPRPAVLDPVVVNEQKQNFVPAEEAGSITINPVNLELFTGLGQPDIVRSMQLLPGVGASDESSGGLSIRGGSGDQNLVLFDGFTIFNLGHFFGTLTAFNSNIVESVDLYKSGFGAPYGSRVAGVVDIESKDFDSKRRVGGSVGMDLMSLNMTTEAAITENISLLLGARRSYTDLVKTNVFNNVIRSVKNNRPGEISEIGEENFIQNIDPDFRFYDVNAKLDVKFNEAQKLRLSFYNSGDNLSIYDYDLRENEASDIYFEQRYDEVTSWGNTGISANFRQEWNPLLESSVTVAHSSSFRSHDFDYYLDFKGEGLNYFEDFNRKDKNSISETSVRVDNIYQIDPKSRIEFGVFNISNHIEYINSFDLNLNNQSLSESTNQFGVFVQQKYSPMANFTLTGGLRGTYYDGTDNTYLEPRLALNYRPVSYLNLKGAIGRYYQFVSQVDTNNPFAARESFWLAADGINVAVTSSNHYVGGLTIENGIVTVDIEGYYKTLNGLTTYALDSASQGILTGNGRNSLYRGTGEVKGMDVMVSKDIGNFSTMVSYSLSYVVHQFENLNNGKEYSANQDQRHEIKWINSVNVGNWEFSGTFIYGSGRPYTGFPFEEGESVSGEDVIDRLIIGGVNTNDLRIPAYHRLDLGVAYTKNLGKYTRGKVGMNLFNVYNRNNIREIRYDFDVNVDNQALVFGERRIGLLNFTPSFYLNYAF